jgi:hypothetical protein
MQLVLKRGRFLFFFFILFSISNSCDKIQDSQVPNVSFRFTINLTIANELTIPGNSMFSRVQDTAVLLFFANARHLLCI